MKNLFRSLLAAAVLFGAAACTTEDISTSVVGNGDPIEVTFTADLGAANTRAYGEGKMANELIVKIYDAHNDALLSDLCPKADEITYNNGKFTFNVVMIKGMEYKILLWAQNSACAEVYTVKDDKTLEIDYSKLANKENNNEKLDAFYYYTPTNDTFDPTEDQPYFELRRPFAQLNAYTNDMAAVRDNGIVKNFKSSVTVSAYTSFNFVNGKVLGNPTNVTFDATAIPSETDGYLSMNYLLASNDGSLINATYVFTGDRNDDSTVTFTGTEYNDVPLKSNHRTNILGALLTKPTDFVVDIKADFGTPDEVVNVVNVASATDLQEAINNAPTGNGESTEIILDGDINLNDLFAAGTFSTRAATTALTIPAGKVITLNLNEKKLYATSTKTGGNYDMIDVRGTLTVTNGTAEVQHTADNMGWSASTNIFNVTAGGVLNLDNVTAKNLGGSDMAFVAHLNNWGEVTLNVDNSTLESTYIPVRVFNSGPDMNNVTIKNSTLNGKYCFWVHNHVVAGDNVGTDETLNLDILNGTNTFVHTGKAPILYGFNNTVYYNIYGQEHVAEGVGMVDGNYYISSAVGLKWVADEVNKVGAQAPNIFDNVTVFLNNDIDLQNTEWTPIGDYAFSRTVFRGTFDGQGHTISNFQITQLNSRSEKVAEASYGLFGNMAGTVQNLNIDNATVTLPSNARFAGALVGRLKEGALINNCHVTNSTVSINHWQVGGIAGQVNDADINNSSISSSTISGKAGVGAIAGFLMVAGDYTIENCEVKGCNIVQNGSFGEDYDTMFGVVAGALNNSGVVLNINNISAEGNTIKSAASNTLVGYVEEGAKWYLNGGVAIANTEQLEAAIKTGGKTTLANDITMTKALAVNNANFELDGNGCTIYQAAECTNTYALFDITGGKATLKNVVFDGVKEGAVVRTVGVEFTADNVTAKNCNHTQQQGLFRLYGKATISNCTFENNNCNFVLTYNFDASVNEPLNVTNCVFNGNNCKNTAVLYYVDGSGATLNGNKFIGNTVTSTSNAATVYMGFTENNVIINNLFKNNAVTTSGTTKRAAGGLMIGYTAEISGNAFIGNTVTGENAKGNDVCASVYYSDIDLSGNYWGGGAPVENDDYFVEYPDKHKVIINDYLTTFGE